MKAFILKHKVMILGLAIIALECGALFQMFTCNESSGMVVATNAPPHVCKCTGWRVTLYDDRPADGNAKFLCLGIPG